MNISSLLRPEVKDFQPYLPGKPIAEVQRELGLKKIVKLASNENALGTSKKVLSYLSRNHSELFRYPDGNSTLLRQALARHWKVSPAEVMLGAGSDELIELLGKTFFKRTDEIIVSEHAFIRYKMAGDLMGTKVIAVPMNNFKHDLSAMLKKVNKKTKAIFIANPNNPTGTYVNRQEVETFFSKLKALSSKRKVRPFVVFDEAYYEYSRQLVSDYPDTIPYLKKGNNLVILRTFSKIYGLAGLRVGYALARKEVIRALDRVRPPFNVSSIAQSAAQIALRDTEHIKKSADAVKKGLEYLTNELQKMGVHFLPTAGNFLLIHLFPAKGSFIFQQLLKKGVIVRAMDEYDFPYHLRVTVGKEEENRFFIQKLKEVLNLA